jgi:hypothetical protein
VADAVKQWIDLSTTKLPEVKRDDPYFQEKMKLALTPVALGSYILHPQYRGNNVYLNLHNSE